MAESVAVAGKVDAVFAARVNLVVRENRLNGYGSAGHDHFVHAVDRGGPPLARRFH